MVLYSRRYRACALGGGGFFGAARSRSQEMAFVQRTKRALLGLARLGRARLKLDFASVLQPLAQKTRLDPSQ